jgi:phosphoribosylformylglycinamidine synthase subunit PurL
LSKSPAEPPAADPVVTSAAFRAHGLSVEDEVEIVNALDRVPTWAELGVFSVLWSEHCSYRATRALLRTLPATGASVQVLHGPGENAGVVALDADHALVFKIESHNHPSQVMPFHGAATGVGGILRDVFTMGARPVALGVALRFGRSARARALADGVLAGLGAYGNAIGVPTITSDLAFDEAFESNALVNAVALGVVARKHLVLGQATPVGGFLVLFGAPTGRDGIHGATMASAAFDGEKAARTPSTSRLQRTIQVGDPFMGKRVLAASVALAEAGLVEGMQDLGAAGLSSSTVEMAARAGTGLVLWLDQVPRRAAGMSAYEVLLSESQERLVAVCSAANLDAVKTLLAREGVPFAVVGEVTSDGLWRVVDSAPADREGTPSAVGKASESKDICCVPVAFLAHGAPPRAVRTGPSAPRLAPRRAVVADLVNRLDSGVGGDTLLAFEGDAGVVRVRSASGDLVGRVALAVGSPHEISTHAEPVAPYDVGVSAVASACLRVAAVGAVPLAVSDGLNFGALDRPGEVIVAGRAEPVSVGSELSEVVRGMAAACRLLSIPVVSGNVSLANQTGAVPIPPTPFVAAVGALPEAAFVVRSRLSPRQLGHTVWLLAAVDLAGLPELINFLVEVGRGAAGPAPVTHVVTGRDVEAALEEMAMPLASLDRADAVALAEVHAAVEVATEGSSFAFAFAFGVLVASALDLGLAVSRGSQLRALPIRRVVDPQSIEGGFCGGLLSAPHPKT